MAVRAEASTDEYVAAVKVAARIGETGMGE
jgi:hypothetical protein